MQLNTDFTDPFGCPLSLDEIYVYPVGTATEAVDFVHELLEPSTASLLT